MAGTHHTMLVDRALNPDQIILLPERVRAKTALLHLVSAEPGRIIISTVSKEEAEEIAGLVRAQLVEWGCLMAPPAPPEAPPAPPEVPPAPPEVPPAPPENEGFDPLAE